MTDLNRPVARRVRRDEVVVTLAPEGVYIRECGRRKLYGPISYRRLLVLGARDIADATIRARKEARAARRRNGR